jgi:transcription initiation factor TFIIIB Brf1 subunit/transcription initiation factor TFIIB
MWGSDSEDIFSGLDCWDPPEHSSFFENVAGPDLVFNLTACPAIDCCSNCGCGDFLVDPARGDNVCSVCGMCDPDNPVYGDPTFEKQPPVSSSRSSRSSKRTLETLDLPGGSSHKRARGTYKRSVYVNERLAQWTLTEPGIAGADWDEIQDGFMRYVIGRGFIPVLPTGEQLRGSRGKRIDSTYVLTKEECGTILEDCDVVREDDSDSVGTVFVHRGHFKRKYFERWMTIRWRFSGIKSKATSTLVDIIQDDFPRLEEAFRFTVDRHERKYFPNYNAMFHFLLELYNCDDLADAFPLPKSLKARNKAEEIWWRFCKFLQWPCLRPTKFLRKRQRQNGRNRNHRPTRKGNQRPPNRHPTFRRKC